MYNGTYEEFYKKNKNNNKTYLHFNSFRVLQKYCAREWVEKKYWKIKNNNNNNNSTTTLYYRVRHLTFFFQLVFISWMVTLSSCLIWQIISFSLSSNEYGCAYAWTMLGSAPAIDLQKMTILVKKKKLCFQMKLILISVSM